VVCRGSGVDRDGSSRGGRGHRDDGISGSRQLVRRPRLLHAVRRAGGCDRRARRDDHSTHVDGRVSHADALGAAARRAASAPSRTPPCLLKALNDGASWHPRWPMTPVSMSCSSNGRIRRTPVCRVSSISSRTPISDGCFASLPAQTDLVIDLGGVEFLGSHGIGQLVTCAENIRSRGGTFSVVCPVGSIAFDVLKLVDVLELLAVQTGTSHGARPD